MTPLHRRITVAEGASREFRAYKDTIALKHPHRKRWLYDSERILRIDRPPGANRRRVSS